MNKILISIFTFILLCSPIFATTNVTWTNNRPTTTYDTGNSYSADIQLVDIDPFSGISFIRESGVCFAQICDKLSNLSNFHSNCSRWIEMEAQSLGSNNQVTESNIGGSVGTNLNILINDFQGDLNPASNTQPFNLAFKLDDNNTLRSGTPFNTLCPNAGPNTVLVSWFSTVSDSQIFGGETSTLAAWQPGAADQIDELITTQDYNRSYICLNLSNNYSINQTYSIFGTQYNTSSTYLSTIGTLDFRVSCTTDVNQFISQFGSTINNVAPGQFRSAVGTGLMNVFLPVVGNTFISPYFEQTLNPQQALVYFDNVTLNNFLTSSTRLSTIFTQQVVMTPPQVTQDSLMETVLVNAATRIFGNLMTSLYDITTKKLPEPIPGMILGINEFIDALVLFLSFYLAYFSFKYILSFRRSLKYSLGKAAVVAMEMILALIIVIGFLYGISHLITLCTIKAGTTLLALNVVGVHIEAPQAPWDFGTLAYDGAILGLVALSSSDCSTLWNQHTGTTYIDLSGASGTSILIRIAVVFLLLYLILAILYILWIMFEHIFRKGEQFADKVRQPDYDYENESTDIENI